MAERGLECRIWTLMQRHIEHIMIVHVMGAVEGKERMLWEHKTEHKMTEAM